MATRAGVSIFEELAQKWEGAFNRRDADAVAALYTSDCIAYDPAYPEPLRGREAFRKSVEVFFKASADVRIKLFNITARDDTGASEWVMTGTHTGPLEGSAGTIPATGRRFELRGAWFGRLNAQGLIAEERGYYDVASFMAQLGLTGS